MSGHDHHNDTGEMLEDPAAAPTWVIGLMSVGLLAFTFLALQGVETIGSKSEFARKQLQIEPPELMNLIETQEARINRAAHWERVVVDGQEIDRYLTIPIDEAMRAIATEAGG
ncbi:MAG: hypothetical protein ACYTF9_05875 [Planctomycetota bacterium]|jgi:hypothetical protein